MAARATGFSCSTPDNLRNPSRPKLEFVGSGGCGGTNQRCVCIKPCLVDGLERTLKTYSRHSDKITLTPLETKRHSPRMCHARHITIQGIPVEIVRRSARRKQ